MGSLKKYICEIVFAINLLLIVPNHDFNIWWQRPIINDAMGYYTYLPAIFIYHSFNYDFIEEPWKKHYKFSHDNPKGAFVVYNDGKELNKYPPGVAYFQAPFFFMGHIAAKILGKEADGYSNIYMYFLCIGAVFWQYMFFRLLRKLFFYLGLYEGAFAITVPLLSFGTNIWFYTQIFGTYSHLYTLICITLFFYAGLKFFDPAESNKGKYFAWMSIGLSMAVITRNINIIALLLLPCMGFKFAELKNYFSVLKNRNVIVGLSISVLLVFSMLLAWKLQTGHWIVDSYPGESFYWGKPQILKSLFSAHKGWFVWTPLALVGLTGLFYAPRKIALNFLALLALVIYLTSAWWCWDYGTAFSMRAYIDWYLFVALGLGYLFQHLFSRKIAFSAILTVCILLSAVNLLQSVQFMRGILSGTSQGIEYTIKNFFRIRPILEYQISKKVIEDSKLVEENFNSDIQRPYAVCDEKNPFSKGIKVDLDGYTSGKHYTHVRYGAVVKMYDKNNPVLLCVSITNEKDSGLYWRQHEINNYVLAGKAEKVETGIDLPANLPPHSKCAAFFWQPKGNTRCDIDDMYIEFIKAGVE